MKSSLRISIVLSLSLILLAQILLLPILLSLIFIVIICSVWICLKRQKTMPKTGIFMLTALALLSIYFHYQSFLGIEAGVATLSTFLFAKALETKSKRDLIILFNFALFVAASSFLLSQSFVMAVAVFLCLLSCLIGLYRIQSSEFKADHQQQIAALKQDAKHVGKFVLLALPFFIVLFIFFPRLPPLWHIPIPENKGITGISDRMSPGDIAELSQSSALAFRIIGDMNQLPSRKELYWRALVLDEYDGQTWSSNFVNQQPLLFKAQDRDTFSERWEYQYLAADPSVLWIMGLEKSLPLEPRFYTRQDGGIAPDRLRQRSQPIHLRWVGGKAQSIQQSNFIQRLNTRVQRNYDPKAQQLAQQLWDQSQHQPQLYIQKVLNWYQQNNFIYTLAPGVLGQHRIDDFLFNSRQGFCEHYASSFVMLMRYVGIPARVVTGYQGGQLAPDTKSWEVRQLDAHAWTEVFINQQWQRIDPTSIIARQRIDDGMQNALTQDTRILGENSTWNVQRYAMLTQLRVWSDYASYQWQNKIVGYDTDSQQSWLAKLGLNSSYAMILILVGSILGLVAVYFLWIYLKTRQKISSLDRAILKFNKSLVDELNQQHAETFSQWMLRLSGQVDQKDQAVFIQAKQLFEQIKYAQNLKKSQDVQKFNILLKNCTCILKKHEKGLS